MLENLGLMRQMPINKAEEDQEKRTKKIEKKSEKKN